MKRKNGYTVIEIIVLILVLGIITVVGSMALSHAYDNGADEAYESEINLILHSAKRYGEEVKDDIKDSKNGITVTVDKLIEKGYIIANNEGKILDPRDKNVDLNSMKVRITYDIDTEKISVIIVS